MKTTLHFEAPSDLSVGTIRIESQGDIVADWVVTPDNRTLLQDDLKAGIYSAEISPAGVAPQSVIFEINEGQANNVVLPSFSALASSGSNMSFFNADSQTTFAQIPDSEKLNVLEKLDLPAYQIDEPSDIVYENILESNRSWQISISTEKKNISIGLSEEKNGRETFYTFLGQSRMTLFSGQLEIEVPTDLHRDHWACHRVRLSASIEQVRIERCLLPLYRGGTRITLAAPPFSPADIELNILPVDPRLRALVRALDAGTSAEVTAVRNDVLGQGDLAALLTDQADPWAAILTGLLAIRFPEIFQAIDMAWADKLVERAGWAFDAYVIRANQTLIVARTASPEAQSKAVGNTIAFLAKAQVMGSPYYRYTNQLFMEMATDIADYLKTNKSDIDPATLKKFDRLYGRWHRELPLQRGAGSTFTWLARDQAALKEHKILVPYRRPSGKLRSRGTSIIFEGQISAGQITIGRSPNSRHHLPSDNSVLSCVIEPSESTPEHDFSQMPALSRAPGPDDDPNKGRFGGQSSRGAFHLTAVLGSTKSRNLVTVILTIEAEQSAEIGLGDFAWFVLHPTFSPSVLKVAFRGNRARLHIQARGRFTVGVWLPKADIELEYDLTQIEVTPKVIKLLGA